jgi:hypothetical protein
MIKLMTAITLRRGEDVWFGTVVRMGRSQLGLFCDGELRAGDFVEWQFELTGWGRTVAGVGEVRKADHRPDDLHRYLVQILEMRRSDRETLEDWYQECAGGGEEGEGALDSGVGSNVPPPCSGARAEPARVREPGGAGRARRDWSSLPSLSVSQTADEGGHRREALRAVLRAACREPEPSEPWKDPLQEVGVLTLVHGWRSPPLVELRYADHVAWRADWQAWLRQGLAFARGGGGVLVLDQEVRVRLWLPGVVDLTCPAQVVMLHWSGFGMALDLDPQQQETLRAVSEEVRAPGGQVPLRPDLRPGAASPLGRAFWARLFGLDLARDPLEQAIAELVDPLASLDLGPARNRQRLDAILGKAERNYLMLCNEVADLIAQVGWRWPELEELTRTSRKPLAEATALIVLTHVVRREAVATVRAAAAASGDAPPMVEVAPDGGPPCDLCRPHVGVPSAPVDLVRSGLPPYHLGCRCRVIASPCPPSPPATPQPTGAPLAG